MSRRKIKERGWLNDPGCKEKRVSLGCESVNTVRIKNIQLEMKKCVSRVFA